MKFCINCHKTISKSKSKGCTCDMFCSIKDKSYIQPSLNTECGIINDEAWLYDFSCLNEIKKLYSSQTRHYHNLDHVQHMIKNIENSSYANKLNNFDQFILKLAIIYHDCIYEFGSKLNEYKSIEKFSDHYNKYFNVLINKQSYDKIILAILCTINHEVIGETHTQIQEAIIDLDLYDLRYGSTRKIQENTLALFNESIINKGNYFANSHDKTILFQFLEKNIEFLIRYQDKIGSTATEKCIYAVKELMSNIQNNKQLIN